MLLSLRNVYGSIVGRAAMGDITKLNFVAKHEGRCRRLSLEDSIARGGWAAIAAERLIRGVGRRNGCGRWHGDERLARLDGIATSLRGGEQTVSLQKTCGLRWHGGTRGDGTSRASRSASNKSASWAPCPHPAALPRAGQGTLLLVAPLSEPTPVAGAPAAAGS